MNDEIKEINDIIFIVFLCISIFSASLIFIFFLCNANLRKFPFKLIFYLCISSILSDSFYLLNEKKGSSSPDAVCKLLGWGDSFFGMQCYAYGTMIALVLISKTFRSSIDFDKNESWMHLISFFVNVSISVIPFCFNKYNIDEDQNVSGCWITSTWAQVIGYYLIIWIEMLLVLIGYGKLVHYYWKFLRNQEKSTLILEQYNNAKTLFCYPLIMLLVVIYRSIYRFAADDMTPVWIVLATILGNSTGTLAVIVFGCTGIIKETLRQKIKKITNTHRQTYSEENSGDLGNNMDSVLKGRDLEPEDSWVNLDRNQIEEEIKNSLGNSLN
jgi:hypothetical protein